MDHSDFRHLVIYWNKRSCHVMIDGQVSRPWRLHHLDENQNLLVLKIGGHSYSSLDRSAYSPAEFQVFEIVGDVEEWPHGVWTHRAMTKPPASFPVRSILGG